MQAVRSPAGWRPLAVDGGAVVYGAPLAGGRWPAGAAGAVGAGGAPKGVVHFLGGAFVGATPAAAYGGLLKGVREAGYGVLCTPYDLTFNHAACARDVRERFRRGVGALEAQGEVPEGLPAFGLGHSNGALLHALSGASGDHGRSADVLISFNNKQVSDAVPVPGAVEALGGQASRLQPLPAELARAVGAAALPPELSAEAEASVLQLGTLIAELESGVTDFTPAPAESRELIRRGYDVPRALLIGFSNDSIDETPALAGALEGGTVLKLRGTHATPCAPDIAWPVGRTFTPVDAVALGLKSLALLELRTLINRTVQFLDA